MKTTKRPSVNDATAQRLNIRVTQSAYERLLVHAMKARKSPGEIVTDLIETHLRAWKVQENSSARARILDRLEIAGPVSDSAPSEPVHVAA